MRSVRSKRIVLQLTAFSLLLLLISGCSTAMKADGKIAATLKQMDANMTKDCRAGLAVGITSASKIDPELALSLQAITRYADVNSEEYKRCYTDGAWATFTIHGTGDLIKKVVTEIGQLPASAATCAAK